MGIFFSKAEPPPPMVLVPPLFDYPPLAARTRMAVPAYELMFGKLSLHNLFEDYFDQAGNMTSRIMLKPLEDPHVDLIATVSAAADQNSGTEVKGDALFRWQKELDDPHTFVDLLVSTSNPLLQLRSCAYDPNYRIGAFGTLPLLMGNRVRSEDYGVMGVRYGSENLSVGASFVPIPLSSEVPFGAWLVGRKGSLTAGVQYKPISGSKNPMPFTELENWNCAISYGVGSTSPLSPSFIFSLELARSTQLTASFYQHLVVQRRVKNPFEDDQVVGITNYIDFGLELAARVDKDKATENGSSLFQLAASWQANKNFLLKGKLGPSKSSVALAFKSWWRPSFTFSVTAVNDHSMGTTSYGFGLRVEDLRQASYQRADPNYVMLTPSKEHLAPGVLREYGKRPMFQTQIDSGNYDHLPTELKPIGKIF
ncbi:hypothetical protein SEVIR_3G137000v4 [Setaria viridis]|uniref:Uncharacterized protein n=1 Tax=Setaria viridis TaxID=4556 RepID=A0A4V6D9E7_SETVI|nr:uncharacterized protein LOC117851031 [Setaria viridis]TKW25726.1 hypothetical protein SEVIR_3G137000v2 [Setaria viridis]